jgi:energy-coupling factor transporter transmembrane protein EcfT
MLLFTSFFIDTLNEAIFGLAAVGVAILFALIRGYRPKGLKILLPALLGVLSLGLSNLWLSQDPNLTNAMIAALRLAYFVIPSLLLARHLNASILGDQIGQLARLPARPVIAGMVALGRVTHLQETWRHLEMVRKLRGLDIHREPEVPLTDRMDIMKDKFKKVFGRIWELTFQLLLQSIRRGTVTAVAIEARGFSAIEKGTGKLRNRTWAVEAQLTKADGTLVAIAALCGLAAIIG